MSRSKMFFVFAATILIFMGCLIVFIVEPTGILCFVIGLTHGWIIKEMSEIW